LRVHWIQVILSLPNEMVEGAVENHHYDELIAGKTAYLNQGFFWLRTIAYLSVWLFFVNLL